MLDDETLQSNTKSINLLILIEKRELVRGLPLRYETPRSLIWQQDSCNSLKFVKSTGGKRHCIVVQYVQSDRLVNTNHGRVIT